MSDTHRCFFSGQILSGYAEATRNGRRTVVAKLPETGEYTVTSEGLAVLPQLTEAEKRIIYDMLVANHAEGGGMLTVSRSFIESMVEREFDDA
jgi:hypothetical protein